MIAFLAIFVNNCCYGNSFSVSWSFKFVNALHFRLLYMLELISLSAISDEQLHAVKGSLGCISESMGCRKLIVSRDIDWGWG